MVSTATPAPAIAPSYEADGPDVGPALVLMHPLGADLRFWDRCRTAWAGRHRLVAYDRAGAGGSPPPASVPTRQDLLAELEALRNRLGLAAVIPVGVAIGAMIAAAYAAAYPEHVASLVLCNPATHLPPAGREMTLARLERLQRCGIEALLPDAVDRAFHDMPRDATYRDYLGAFRRNDPRGYAMSARAALDLDITEDLPRIACPVLVLAGERDVLFAPEQAREVAAALPRARYRGLPDAAHFPPIQDTAAFAAAVDSFLAEAVAPA